MKIISTSVGQVYCSKPPNVVTETIDENHKREYTLGISDFDIKKNIGLITSINIDFPSEKGDEPTLKFRCYVVVKIKLDNQELNKDKEEIQTKVKHHAFVESWPIFESQVKLLKDFKVRGYELPPIPPEGKLEDTLNK